MTTKKITKKDIDRRRRVRRSLLDMAEREIKTAVEALQHFEQMPDHEKPSGFHDSVDGAIVTAGAALLRIEAIKALLP